MIDLDEIQRVTSALTAELKAAVDAFERDCSQENFDWSCDVIARAKAWNKHTRALLKAAELDFLQRDCPSMAMH